jgi:phage terminase small subunit
MAGVKGKSGGFRPGAGRKPAPATKNIGAALADAVVQQAVKVVAEVQAAQPLANDETTPLEFLLAAMRNPGLDDKLRLDAAKTAAMYCHLKKGDGGIKDEKAEKAKKAGAGKFAAAPAPLRMVK